jgi:hypothetical protein
MTGVVPVNPRTKFTNSSGVPYAGGTLTVYLAGTTTLATTYQDKTLLSANTNPITLDANGECLLWVDSAYTYKYLLKDSSGATVSGYPVDNIPGAADIGAAATAAAAAAATSATAAATSAASAAAALSSTETARDAALAATKIYASTAAGLAAVAAGEYFYVPSTDSNESLILYLDNAGVAEEKKRYPSARLTGELARTSAVQTLYEDDLALSRNAAEVGTKRAVQWIGIGQSNNTDERPYAAGETSPLNYAVTNAKMPNAGFALPRLADIAGNVETFVAQASDFATLATLVPRATYGSKAEGIGVRANLPSSFFLAALGGRAYSAIKRGTGNYTTMVGAMRGMTAAWRALGYEPDINIFQAHGETNAGAGTSYATYTTYLEEWLDHIRRDVQWVLRRPLYQTKLFGVNITYTGTEAYKQIAAAQTDFWLTTDGAYHCGGIYQFPTDADRVHGTGLSQVLQGELIAKVAQYVEAGEDWKPTHMLPFRRSGATVTVPVHVPRGNLTLDTTIVPEPSTLDGKYGLEFYYGGVAQTISTVTISGNNIVITLSADPGAAGTEEVRYALQTVAAGNLAVPTNLARGNFRDQDTTYARHDPSYILYNWMVPQIVARAA